LVRRIRKLARLRLGLFVAAILLAAACMAPSREPPNPDRTPAMEHHGAQPDEATAKCQQFGCSP
jgi:hypothetical protein